MILIFGILIFSMVATWVWVDGIDYMNKKFKEYKGYDLFDEKDED